MLSRLTLALSLLVFCTSSALARSTTSASQARDFPAPPVQARSAVVMDASNGQVLLAYNAHVRRPIASTTKIMTALLALQLGSLTDKIRVPKSAFNYESDATVMGLHPGQTVTLKDLLYGLMLPSGADAANTIAIHYAGSEAAWVKMMNHEAGVLNMHDTHYTDAHGLSDTSVSSTYDLAVLAQYVSYLPDLMKITSTRSYRWNGQTLVNLNRPLYWYPGVDGIKPGFTNEAGMCQVLDARRDGRHVVAAILNTPTLVIDARNLLNFGLRDYSWVQSALEGDGPSLAMKGTDSSGPYTYYVSSGHYLRGKFVSGFANSGGLAALGYPRTEQLTQGKLRVQYFQNGVLALDTRTGKISRLPIGTTISPAAKPTPTPTATRTPTPTPTPAEGSLPGRRLAAPSKTPTPKPTAKPTSTPAVPSGANVVNRFQQAHARLLGAPVSALRAVRGYQVQIFQYGAVALDPRSHAVWLLPVGDRALSLLHSLAAHPGTAYPGGFAPASVLKAVGWLSSR